MLDHAQLESQDEEKNCSPSEQNDTISVMQPLKVVCDLLYGQDTTIAIPSPECADKKKIIQVVNPHEQGEWENIHVVRKHT